MATYAKQSDFEAYSEGWVTTDANALERLLERAEKDIDRIIRRAQYLTGAIFGIAMSGVTGGNFSLSMVWNGVTYTSTSIVWNPTGDMVIAAMGDMADQYGNLLPLSVWNKPEQSYYTQPWAYGPLPGVPVIVEAYNELSQQRLALPTANTSGLIGTNPSVTITQIVGGGLRINPYLLSSEDANILTQATCAQAEYRNEMGESFFKRAQFQSVQGPQFRTQGKLPLIGPKVFTELSGSDLLQRGARARPGTVRGRQMVYAPVGGVPIPDDWRSP